MDRTASFIKHHSLVVYFVLAYVFSWIMVALISVAFVFGLLALFGPALAAILVTAFTEGKAGVRVLLRRVVLWRVAFVWYAVAVGVPFLVALFALGVHAFTSGAPFAISTGTPVSLLIILAILVVGEEIGWRGFALPHLQARYDSLIASLILGVLWAGWHLANASIPGLEYYWYGFPAFLVFVVAQTILFTWLANHTRSSVLLAWIFHASINVSNSLFFIGEQVKQWWLAGAGFAAIGLIVILLTGPNLGRKPQVELEVTAVNELPAR
jgi:membrane protease YdiL (CAAX protease family)